MPILFPFSEYWWLYGAFTLFVLALLSLDLGVFHRKAHEVSFREATIWCAVWVSLALVFNYGFYLYADWKFAQDPRLLAVPGFDPAAAARQVALEFLSGYIVEESLSVDNMFIFVVVFSYFGVPARYQHRLLFYGIIGAILFRAAFIALGAALIQYHTVVLLFGAFLILTGVKMLFTSEQHVNPEKNLVIRLLRRMLPVTSEMHGQRFFVTQNGKRYATPLLLALVFVEMTDIVFAVDSVPAIFALTKEPLVVFTSNIFAVLGLRSLYFMLAGAVGRFYLLRYALALVLMFVGLKMAWLNGAFGGKFPTSWSLAIIGGLIGASIAGSLLFPRRPRPVEDSA